MRAAVLTAVLLGLAAPARAQDDRRAQVEAAAARFDLPVELLETVIAVESGGRSGAVSSAGAMGLMQLMPRTWAEVRERLKLGSDPFDQADNILAGAAYLRQLRDRYGAPGYLAAYNAGPGRYEESLAGRPLPVETRLYVARIVARLGGVDAPATDWRAVGLFPPAWTSSLGRTSQAEPEPARASDEVRLFVTRRPSQP